MFDNLWKNMRSAVARWFLRTHVTKQRNDVDAATDTTSPNRSKTPVT